MKKISLLFFVILPFILLISACGKNESVNNQTGNAPEEKKQESKSETAKSVSLPEDFPKEFPQPPDSKIILVNKSGNGVNVTYHTTAKIEALSNLYKAAAEKESYKLKSEGTAGGGVTLSFEKFGNKKDSKFIIINIIPDIKANSVILSFNYSKAK